MSRVRVVGGPCNGCSSGVLCWCLGGLWTGMGGVCGARSRLVALWIMHGMVMDETQHVLPGGGVGELLLVYSQEAPAGYHLGRCSADCLWLEVGCCPHPVPRIFGEVPLQGLCHRPSHGDLLDQGIPEEEFGGLLCVAVGWPAFVLL